MKCLLLGAWCALLLAAPAAAQPQIQPATVKIANSPNVLAWPVTSRISRIELADNGVRVTFDKCATWPDVTPPGWTGPLRFTLWLFENIGGEWYASGIIQFWGCDQYNGGPVYWNNQVAREWLYDNRWSSMVGHQPAPGERIGFMVSAGNARGRACADARAAPGADSDDSADRSDADGADADGRDQHADRFAECEARCDGRRGAYAQD
jgi:hypothetical protein